MAECCRREAVGLKNRPDRWSVCASPDVPSIWEGLRETGVGCPPPWLLGRSQLQKGQLRLNICRSLDQMHHQLCEAIPVLIAGVREKTSKPHLVNAERGRTKLRAVRTEKHEAPTIRRSSASLRNGSESGTLPCLIHFNRAKRPFEAEWAPLTAHDGRHALQGDVHRATFRARGRVGCGVKWQRSLSGTARLALVQGSCCRGRLRNFRNQPPQPARTPGRDETLWSSEPLSLTVSREKSTAQMLRLLRRSEVRSFGFRLLYLTIQGSGQYAKALAQRSGTL